MKEVFTLAKLMLEIVGMVVLFVYFFRLLDSLNKYLEIKTYQLQHKKVCDSCFKGLKSISTKSNKNN